MNPRKDAIPVQPSGLDRRWPLFFQGPGRRGVALLLTILIVALISASVITFIRMTTVEARMAENAYNYAQAEILADGGVKGAMLVLAMDEDLKVDSLDESWAMFEQLASMSSQLFEEGSFTGKIEDLSARLNVNALVDRSQGLKNKPYIEALTRLIPTLLPDIDEQKALTMVNAMVDWVDSNDSTEEGGAENAYYQGLEDPYFCRNGPVVSVGELVLVKDMTPAILYGTQDQVGLSEFLGLYSDGPVNINTAGPKVLMSLHEDLTEPMVEEIMARRLEEPFEKVDDLKSLPGMSSKVFVELLGRELITIKSSFFQITVEGHFREAVVRVTAVVQRNTSGNLKLIYYRAG